jgi:hypothetical protein
MLDVLLRAADRRAGRPGVPPPGAAGPPGIRRPQLAGGVTSLGALAGLCGLERLAMSNLPKPTGFPDLAGLTSLRRVARHDLNRLERLDGLARAAALDEFHHTGLGSLPPASFDLLLDHPAPRYFTATVRAPASKATLEAAAARKGKRTVDPASRPTDFEP